MRLLARIIPKELRCPHCGRFHVDYEEWAQIPHHTHLCEHCDGEFDEGTGHTYFAGVPPHTFKGRLHALAHRFEDLIARAIS